MNAHWPYDSVLVEGPDALTYLHSQLSQDLRNLAVGDSAWSFVLEPTGKVDALVQVLRTGEETFELRVDRGQGEALLARINRFRIRVKAETSLGAGAVGDPVAYHAERVRAGWPAAGAEITEATIPAEMPDVVALAVSFSKGCYPGQELVERMDSRASQAPRRLAVLRLPAGTSVGDPVEVAGEQVGTVTSVAADDSGVIALALVRRGVEVPAELQPSS
jgi:folate-binding protein YgfZ